MTPKEKAKDLLEKFYAAPGMWTQTKEGTLCHISGIMMMAVENWKSIDFFLRHLESQGSAILGLSDTSTDQWAKECAQEALDFLGR